MHNFLIGIILSLGSFLGIYHPQQFGVAVSQTIQGGTGTSSPSGILYGDNSATGHLNTVSIGSNLTFAAGTLSASGGTSAIATSSAETAGQLSYWTSTSATPATLGKVATGTISSSGGVTVTAGRAAVGGALAIGCTAADTSNTGCLSSTDWNTFNGKLSWPWTVATTYSTSTNSTTTPTWFKTALYASSTLATSSVIDALVSTYSTSTNATSTNEYVSGQFKNGSASGLALETSGVFSNVTTGTIGSTGVLGLSGGTPAYVATSSLFGTDTNGKVLALSSGAAAWVASTTFSAGSGISLAQAGNTWTITNTGSYPFATVSSFGTTTAATTTPIWTQTGLFASSTFIADNATTSNATTTNLYASGQTRLASLTGLALTTSGVVSAYGGTSCTNQFPRSLNASGAASCASVANTDIAAMSSANLATIISDETGTAGKVVFDTTPTFVTNITDPLVIGGGAAASTLTLKSTSGTGVGGDGIIFQIGSNGATEAMRMQLSGIGIGTSTPQWALQIASSTRPQLQLSDGSLTSAGWTFRNAGGFLYIASSSPSTFATSTLSQLTLSTGGQLSLPETVIATSTAITVDWNNTSNQVLIQTGTGATTIGFTNASTSGMQKKVVVCNPTSAAGAVTFPVPGLLWTGGTAPTATVTANKCDVWSFIVTQATSTSSGTTKVLGAATANF